MEVPTLPKPRYDLDPDELKKVEEDLVNEINSISPIPDVYCVWVQPDSPYANIARTQEALHWSYIAEVMSDKEDRSQFLLVVDTRDPASQGVKRVSRITFAVEDPETEQSTGMAIIDDVIDSGQGLTLEAFVDFYKDKGVDISRCFSVETNIRVEKANRYNELPLAEVGYLAMFKKIDELRQGGLSYIFATINQDSINSFKLIDLQAEPIAGRNDLQTPAENGEFDQDFQTVALPTTDHNVGIFRNIESLCAPILQLK